MNLIMPIDGSPIHVSPCRQLKDSNHNCMPSDEFDSIKIRFSEDIIYFINDPINDDIEMIGEMTSLEDVIDAKKSNNLLVYKFNNETYEHDLLNKNHNTQKRSILIKLGESNSNSQIITDLGLPPTIYDNIISEKELSERLCKIYREIERVSKILNRIIYEIKPNINIKSKHFIYDGKFRNEFINNNNRLCSIESFPKYSINELSEYLLNNGINIKKPKANKNGIINKDLINSYNNEVCTNYNLMKIIDLTYKYYNYLETSCEIIKNKPNLIKSDSLFTDVIENYIVTINDDRNILKYDKLEGFSEIIMVRQLTHQAFTKIKNIDNIREAKGYMLCKAKSDNMWNIMTTPETLLDPELEDGITIDIECVKKKLKYEELKEFLFKYYTELIND